MNGEDQGDDTCELCERTYQLCVCCWACAGQGVIDSNGVDGIDGDCETCFDCEGTGRIG